MEVCDRSVAEIELTDAMIEAGEKILLCEFGSVSFHWNPRDLAVSVYRAMACLCTETHPDHGHTA